MHIVRFTHQRCVEQRSVKRGWYTRYEGRAIFDDGVERDVHGSCVSPPGEVANIYNWAPKAEPLNDAEVLKEGSPS